MKAALRTLDQGWARSALKLGREPNGLLVLTFHGTFESEREANCGDFDPQQAITIAHVHECVERLLDAKYTFIAPDDLAKVSDPGRYAMLTFDDGCASNRGVLPILDEFRIPAAFYISTHHTAEQKAFWWDVVYRERHKQGVNGRQIAAEQAEIKLLQFDAIDKHLLDAFGPDSMKPGTLDRAMTIGELKEFAKHPQVVIGNHTTDHAILTTLESEAVRAQIQKAQDDLTAWTGRRPTSIAYPNGNNNESIRRIARECGLTTGFTVAQGKFFPGKGNPMAIPRYTIWGQKPIGPQIDGARSSASILDRLKR